MKFVELRLDEESFGIELTVHDEEGQCAIIVYAFEFSSPGFDMTRLVRAWARWRQELCSIATAPAGRAANAAQSGGKSFADAEAGIASGRSTKARAASLIAARHIIFFSLHASHHLYGGTGGPCYRLRRGLRRLHLADLRYSEVALGDASGNRRMVFTGLAQDQRKLPDVRCEQNFLGLVGLDLKRYGLCDRWCLLPFVDQLVDGENLHVLQQHVGIAFPLQNGQKRSGSGPHPPCRRAARSPPRRAHHPPAR